MKVKDYARLIGRSPQFVRTACLQGKIKAIVIEHDARHEYEILEGSSYEDNQKGSEVVTVCGVGDRALDNLC